MTLPENYIWDASPTTTPAPPILANTLTRCGLRTVQTIGVPDDALALPEVDAVVVSLKSRSIEAGLAVSRSRSAEKWLRGHGAQHVLFKICSTFDSTDAGNIGPVMDALRADSGDAIVLVTPAFPETGRTVYMGNLFVGSLPLNESPLKDHPLNPMHDSNLVRVLARQSRIKIGLIGLADIARGPDAVRARLADLSGKGFGAAIVDAAFDRDLETIGAVALDHRLSVGASGIGLGLARALVASGKIKSSVPSAAADATVGGPAACLAGSCSQATLQQIAACGSRRCRCCASIRIRSSPGIEEDSGGGVRWPGPGTASERAAEGPVSDRQQFDLIGVAPPIRSQLCNRDMAAIAVWAMPLSRRWRRYRGRSGSGYEWHRVWRAADWWLPAGETSGAVVDPNAGHTPPTPPSTPQPSQSQLPSGFIWLAAFRRHRCRSDAGAGAGSGARRCRVRARNRQSAQMLLALKSAINSPPLTNQSLRRSARPGIFLSDALKLMRSASVAAAEGLTSVILLSVIPQSVAIRPRAYRSEFNAAINTSAGRTCLIAGAPTFPR